MLKKTGKNQSKDIKLSFNKAYELEVLDRMT